MYDVNVGERGRWLVTRPSVEVLSKAEVPTGARTHYTPTGYVIEQSQLD